MGYGHLWSWDPRIARLATRGLPTCVDGALCAMMNKAVCSSEAQAPAPPLPVCCLLVCLLLASMSIASLTPFCRSHRRRCRLQLSCHVLVSSFRTRTSCMSQSRGRTVKSSIYMDGPPHREVMCMYVWQYVHTLHVMHNKTCHIHTQINRRDACSSTLSRNCRREASYIVDGASESRV